MRWLSGRGDARTSGVPLVGLALVALVSLPVSAAVVGVATDPAGAELGLCRFVAAVSLRAGACEPPELLGADDDAARVYGPPVCRVYAEADERGRSVRTSRVATRTGDVLVQESSGGAVRVVAVAPADEGTALLAVGEPRDGSRPPAVGTREVGDSWEVPDADAWEELRTATDVRDAQLDRLTSGVPVAEAWWLAESGQRTPPPPAPSSTLVRGVIDLDEATALGVGPRPSVRRGQDDDPLALAAGARGAVTILTGADGTQTWTYHLEGVRGADVDEGALGVTRDAVGDVRELVLRSVAPGERRDSEVTTTTLGVDDDDRAAVDAWLGERAPAGRSDGVRVEGSALVPGLPSPRTFGDLLYRGSTTSVITYRGVRDDTAFRSAVRDGWALGLAVRARDVGARTADATYLGSPSRTGERLMIPEARCTGGASF
ncbi:hypothetical protein ACWFNE_04885 [Cellulomonas sp. NPDC055163]